MNMILLLVDDHLLLQVVDNQLREVDSVLNVYLMLDRVDKVKELDRETSHRSPSQEKINKLILLDKVQSKCIH